MNWQRWLRDGLILVVCALGSYGSYWWFSQASEGADAVEKALLSSERQVADSAMQRRSWTIAHENLELLVQNDPYNGYAWYHLGLSRWNLCRPLLEARTQELGATPVNSDRLAEINEQLQIGIRDAREALTKALESAKYRNSARYLLAVIHVAQGEVEEAVRELHMALDDGFVRRGGVDSNDVALIRDHPDYDALREKEYKNLRAASYLMPVFPRRPRNNN
jgi:cytochrome c-type biogenesis protein CcmH/NrfG